MGRKPIDLTGQRFGALTVIRRVPDPNKKQVLWECKCDCGNTCVRSTILLTHDISISCGCMRRGKSGLTAPKLPSKPRRIKFNHADYTGQTIGKLTGIQVGINGEWLWRCDCGGLLFATADEVVNGKVKSCGCFPDDEDRRIDAPAPAETAPALEYADKRTAPRSNGSPIAQLRVERGLTQTQLANMIGVRYGAVSQWERGVVRPSKDSLLKLADALQCGIGDLIDQSNPRCRVCGRIVNPPRSVFCSETCAYTWKQRQKRVENPRKSPGGALYIPRVCPDCGAEYIGHIRTKRCPGCQAEADRRANAECKQRMAQGHTRRLGSTDICEMCGEPYIVNSGKQRYCKACAEKAVRENIRRNKRDYNKALYADPEKREQKNSARRIYWQQERVCAVCGKSFMPQTNRQKFCGADCRTINRRNQQKIADAKRSPRKNNKEDNHV